MKKMGIFSNLLIMFGLGLLAGILFAPRSGDKTRKTWALRIEDFFGNASTCLIDKAAMFKGRVYEYMDELKEKIEDTE